VSYFRLSRSFTIQVDASFTVLREKLTKASGVINMISEHFVEAANACSINAPYGVSEWALSGLTQAPCTTVNPSRVKEAVFAIEGKLINIIEFDSRAVPGTKSGTMAVIEGTRFWVREDALNKEKNLIDPEVSYSLLHPLQFHC
jgi:flavin reductase (DIM6/NTAB) family NADH-FMN oxidoreductase RutF